MMVECRHCNSTNLFVSFLLVTFLRGSCLQGSLPHSVLRSGNATVDQEDLTSVYVVHVRKPPRLLHAGPEELAAWHRSFLPSPAVDSGEPRLVFSYSKAMNGFAARLTPKEVADMADMESFLYAVPDRKLDLQTTHTPDFLRLRPDVWRAANRGHDVIVGVVDSGINPEHVSFSGSASGARKRPPGKWRGYCEFRGSRTCGRKLLGARNYDSNARGQQPLPYDVEGHGTHVASTVAGGEVPGAGLHGYANGTASGAAPDAFLSVYKAQTVAETLAAINQAIEDGVDVLCIAMAHREAHLPIFLDGVAIGALAAVREGILVVGAAGNHGPSRGTLRNDAPWFMTVGASSTDRALRASLRLGNGADLAGESLYDFDGKLFEKMPLLYPTPKKGRPPSQPCTDLHRGKFQGKIVLCNAGSNTTTELAKAVKDAGGLAVVVMNSPDNGSTVADVPDVDFPALSMDYNTSLQLIDYVSSTRRPIAAFGPGETTFGNHPAPAVASFSARGPSVVNGGILKPDVLGPGVNILAASHAGKSGFLLASGTSVAAAHVAGVAAIVNKSNAGWTPAMMRSAIMTTAALQGGGPITDETGSAASLFATGAGHVNPVKAMDPGLVYDVEFQDYIRYLCGLGYTDVQASVVAGYSVQCATAGSMDAEQLNYPSISVKLAASGARKTAARTLTSVHCAMGLYRARVQLPPGVSAKVSPRRLLFWKRGESKRFTVTFKVTNSTLVKAGQAIGGRLRWSSDMHGAVSSPLQISIV